ncbi:MAG: hypothetical protein GY937_22455 [bacterium]|nr:hypothetical protein [bacterium]
MTAAPQLSPLCDAAERLLTGALQARSTELRQLLARCESPVEEMLLVAMWDKWAGKITSDGRAMTAMHPGPDCLWRLVVEPQRELVTAGRMFRADFFVYLTCDGPTSHAVCWCPTVVEVDGHEFHERTQLQAARDQQRDRAMLLEGMRTVRFTGSEVFNRPAECAAELAGLLRRPRGEVA